MRTTSDKTPLLPVVINDKWGYIDRSGNIRIQPTYIYCDKFHEGLATVTLHDRSGCINESGEMVIQPIFDYIGPFTGGVAVAGIANYFGYINPTGKFILKLKYLETYCFSCGLGRVEVGIDGFLRSGFVDKTGVFTIQPEFFTYHGFSEDLCPVKVGNPSAGRFQRSGDIITVEMDFTNVGKWGYINTRGEIVIEPRFDWAQDFSEGLAVAKMGSDNVFINPSGDVALKPGFDTLWEFTEGLTPFGIGPHEEMKMGYIDRDGNITIAPIFDSASNFIDGLASVLIDGREGYINRDGEIVIEPVWDLADDFCDGVALVGVKDTDKQPDELGLDFYKYGYIDNLGTIIWQPTN